VSTERGDRALDVLGPALADPVEARVEGRWFLNRARDVAAAPPFRWPGPFLDLGRLEPPCPTGLVHHDPAGRGDRPAEAVGLGEVLRRARTRAFIRERADLRGRLAHGAASTTW
jgi:hypothetical protein